MPAVLRAYRTRYLQLSGMRADSSFRKVDGPVCLRSGRVFVCFQDECGSRPFLRSIPLLSLLGGGGGGCRCIPLVVVESDTVQVSGLQLVESDAAQVSVLPVAGWKFRAVFLGKVAFDLVGLGDGPPFL